MYQFYYIFWWAYVICLFVGVLVLLAFSLPLGSYQLPFSIHSFDAVQLQIAIFCFHLEDISFPPLLRD